MKTNFLFAFALMLALFAAFICKLFSPPVVMALAAACVAFFSLKYRRLVLRLESGVCALLLFGLVFIAAPPKIHAGNVGTVDFGVTNATIAVAATNATLGVSTAVIDQQDFATLWFSFSTTAATTSTVYLTLAPVDDLGNVATTGRTTLPFVLSSSTTNFYITTNLGREFIGANYGFSLVSIGNPTGSTIITNPVVKLLKKRLQAPN